MKYFKKLYSFFSLAFWLVIWQVIAMIINKPILLPSPIETLKVFISLLFTYDFWIICFNSLKSIFAGLFVGILLGILLAFLSYISAFLRNLFSPLLSLAKAVPIASIIILLLVWIGKGKIPFVISLMMATPIVSSNFLQGLENINKDLVEVTKVYKFSFSKRWRMLYRHSLLPYLLASLKSSIALSWKAGIAAEVLCTPDKTIGKILNESRLYLEIPTLFAYTLAVILLSYCLEKIVVNFFYKLFGGGINVN